MTKDFSGTCATLSEYSASTLRLDGVRLLLVEDSPDNQMLFHRILTAAGAAVTIAENGLLGVEAAKASMSAGTAAFDAIITDVRMPVLDGYEASRRIRALGYLQPIIALTAHANPGEEERCRGAGCSHFHLKPIDRRSLLSAVVNALSCVNAHAN